MWCTTATTTATSTVPMRPPTYFDGPARAVAYDMWCTTATTTTFVGVPRSFSTKPATFVRCISGKSPWVHNIILRMMPCANVGSKPCYRCGCTDDTPCRLGAAGSMTFFSTNGTAPVQLRDVGPDRGRLLTESCSDVHLHVCRC